MAEILQVDRQYILRVGQGKGTGVEITGLNIAFSVSKDSDNKKRTNKANVKIYNLSEEHQKYLQSDFVEVELLVGHSQAGLYRIFAGQATVVGTEKNGTETVTDIQVDTLYTTLNHKTISKTAPPGVSIKGVIESLAKEIPNITRVVFSGKQIEKAFIDGYPMVGSPRQILNDICEAYQIDWQIDDTIMYIQDAGTSYMLDNSRAFLISETTGLIERPYFDQIEKQRGKGDKLRKARNGLRLKIVMNPALVAGSIIKIEYASFTGFYKIERLKHNGEYLADTWETELYCGTTLQTK